MRNLPCHELSMVGAAYYIRGGAVFDAVSSFLQECAFTPELDEGFGFSFCRNGP